MPRGRDEQALRGRQIETDALYRLLVDARDGHSGVLVLRGEPGVGKRPCCSSWPSEQWVFGLRERLGSSRRWSWRSLVCISCALRC